MSLGNQTVKAKRNLNHSLQCSVIRCEIQGKGNAVFLSAIAMVGNRMFKLLSKQFDLLAVQFTSVEKPRFQQSSARLLKVSRRIT